MLPDNLTALTSDYELNEIAIKVEEKLYQNGARQKASAMELLVKYNEEIGNWLKQRNTQSSLDGRLIIYYTEFIRGKRL